MHGAEYFFAENGKAQCLIALPAKPMGFEQEAADDLRTYLGKITGAEFIPVLFGILLQALIMTDGAFHIGLARTVLRVDPLFQPAPPVPCRERGCRDARMPRQ